MSTNTTRLNLHKPDPGENVNVVTDLNNNWDIIDANLGFAKCTSTTRPSTVWAGLCIFETDTEKTYVSNGSDPASASWVNIPNASSVIESAGITVESVSSSDEALTVHVTGDTNDRMVITAGGVVSWGNGAGATDTNLYRSSSNVLKTDDTLQAVGLSSSGEVNLSGSATGDEAITVAVSGDTNNRFSVLAGGKLGWGSGSAAEDTFLYRSGPNALTLDNDLTVEGDLTVDGIGQVRFVRKVLDSQRTNTTLLQDDSELSLELDANSLYEVEFWLAMTSNGDCDIKTAWSVPTGASGLKSCFGATSTAGSFSGREDTRVRLGVHNFTTATPYQLTTSTFHQWSYERALVETGATAGSLTLQWAQATASASYAEMGANSYMKIVKVG